ncbi:hypothetical protein FACS189434_01670 [Bacteroidia bacterium]|nr:hypothetical protein FACS189434_01670 [Bacteroidia bacterium]
MSFASSQQKTDLKLFNKDVRNVKDYVKSMRMTSFRFDCNAMTGFLNSAYYQNKLDGALKGGYGVKLTVEQRIWLFRLDVGGFYNWFTVNNETFVQSYATKDVTMGGFDLFLSYMLMPDYGKVSDILQPYVGIGYQTAVLKASVKEGEKSSETVGQLGVGTPVWKGGLHINVGKSFFFTGEYIQSLNMSSPKAHYMLLVGIGAGFN